MEAFNFLDPLIDNNLNSILIGKNIDNLIAGNTNTNIILVNNTSGNAQGLIVWQ